MGKEGSGGTRQPLEPVFPFHWTGSNIIRKAMSVHETSTASGT